MAATSPGTSSSTRPQPAFVATRWSVVLAAGGGDTTHARDAIAHICQTYWYPLYAYARRRGCSPHDAQDLTQEFFARLLEGNWVAQADQSRGRFRTFLLTAMKHFMTNEWNKAHAAKRGGCQPVLSLDEDSAEQRYRLEPVEQMTPEILFERGWALALLNDILLRLEQEYAREGKKGWMDALRPALTADRESINYRHIASQLDVTETAARVAVHRLRQRYRLLIQTEVAHTVTSPDQVAAEMRHLFQILAAR